MAGFWNEWRATSGASCDEAALPCEIVHYAPTDPVRRGGHHGGRSAPLTGLAGSSLADRFRAWTGASGRRYVFSVFRLDGTTSIDDLPAEGGSVAIVAQRRHDGSVSPVLIEETGSEPAGFFSSAAVRAFGGLEGCEIHLHLLAQGEPERSAIVRDLRAAWTPGR